MAAAAAATSAATISKPATAAKLAAALFTAPVVTTTELPGVPLELPTVALVGDCAHRLVALRQLHSTIATSTDPLSPGSWQRHCTAAAPC